MKMKPLVRNLLIFLASNFVLTSSAEIPRPRTMEAGYSNEEPLLYDSFPEGFQWGVATASYQVSKEPKA